MKPKFLWSEAAWNLSQTDCEASSGEVMRVLGQLHDQGGQELARPNTRMRRGEMTGVGPQPSGGWGSFVLGTRLHLHARFSLRGRGVRRIG